MYPIDFFYRSARLRPQAIAIKSGSEQVRYGELAARVDALAAAFQALDPAQQSRVGICAPNSVEHIVALLAVLASGKIWVPLNPRNSAAELNRTLEVTIPSIVVVDDKYREGLRLDSVAHVVSARGTHAASLADLVSQYAGCTPAPNTASMDAVQAIKFTGGSTGMPKGVMQPYRAWKATLVNQIHAYRFDEHDRYLLASPITHGASTYILPILAQGGCHVVPEETSPHTILRSLREDGITTSFMPPTLIYMVMAAGEEAGQREFPRLRHLVYGGAPMPPEKIRAAQKFFGPVLATTYGQTEAPQIVTFISAEELAREENIGSVGRMALLADMAIKDTEGRILPGGEVGEIVVRGDLVMAGYWNMPDKTAETIVDGWLHTGDRGFLDERGYLYLRDRLREVIITGGFNVYPIDVEDVLTRHPAVHESAVFGIDDDKWGEAVHAAVQLKPGQQVDAQELIAFAKEALGSVKAPKRIHFYESLPRSPVGKVQKDAVKREVRAQIDLQH
ncbi:class I adenylate-forming enzyme family protein [Noviherbaspirillum malthae]|jgi:acyl-CoA synthetase (AMP-forming)/AMP-acid ligase II|uniref:class I adenylate-forming enzyme family protein n=1 Tax=Noviherbaspirillum malthae TaxID=1260987 RepID=UPI00188F5595|nr:AMP-binding protein [Noviherbaspirillum malthae]